MVESRRVRAVLKRILVPELEAFGFEGQFPEFKRAVGERLQLLSVQFDKHGGGFFLEFANHPPGDLTTSWGEVVTEADITLAHTPIERRARLQRHGHQNSLSEDWFRYEDPSLPEVEDLVRSVCALLPQVEAWLQGQRIGPNISAKDTE